MDWAQVASVVAAVGALYIAAVSIAADHERRRKQATIEVWRDYLKDTFAIRAALRQFYGTDVIPQRDALDYRNAVAGKAVAGKAPSNKYAWVLDFQLGIQELLGGLEEIAAGANLGVYDTPVLFDIGGQAIEAVVKKRLRYCIQVAQDQEPASVYTEMTTLCEKFQKLKGSPRGSIKRRLPGFK